MLCSWIWNWLQMPTTCKILDNNLLPAPQNPTHRIELWWSSRTTSTVCSLLSMSSMAALDSSPGMGPFDCTTLCLSTARFSSSDCRWFSRLSIITSLTSRDLLTATDSWCCGEWVVCCGGGGGGCGNFFTSSVSSLKRVVRSERQDSICWIGWRLLLNWSHVFFRVVVTSLNAPDTASTVG